MSACSRGTRLAARLAAFVQTCVTAEAGNVAATVCARAGGLTGALLLRMLLVLALQLAAALWECIACIGGYRRRRHTHAARLLAHACMWRLACTSECSRFCSNLIETASSAGYSCSTPQRASSRATVGGDSWCLARRSTSAPRTSSAAAAASHCCQFTLTPPHRLAATARIGSLRSFVAAERLATRKNNHTSSQQLNQRVWWPCAPSRQQLLSSCRRNRRVAGQLQLPPLLRMPSRQ